MKRVYFENGITLISIVITIIIILIMLGIITFVAIGDNPIIKKTQDAVKINDKEWVKEIVLLSLNQVKIKNAIIEMSKEEIKSELENEIKNSSGIEASVEIRENMFLISIKDYILEFPTDLSLVNDFDINRQIILEKSFEDEKILYECDAKFDEDTAIKIEFANDTVSSDNLVNIHVFDSNGNFIKSYANTSLSGKTIYINDKGVKFKLQTSRKISNYIFKCAITSTNEIEYGGMETPHPYKTNADYAFTNTINDAQQLLVKFSENSKISYKDEIVMYSFNKISDTVFEYSKDKIIESDKISSNEFIVSKNTISMVLSSNNLENNSQYGIKYTIEKYTTPDNVLESYHNYENNLDGKTYEKTIDDASMLRLTFNNDTYFESSDWISIYYKSFDGEENLMGRYTGDELRTKELFIPSNNVKIMLYTDGAISYYGFRCEVESISDVQYMGNEVIIESPHTHINDMGLEEFGYENNRTYDYQAEFEENVDGIYIEFDDNSIVEEECDFIYMHNDKNEIIASITGEFGKKIMYIPNINKIRIEMITDDDTSFWGFKCIVRGYKVY